MKSIKFSKSYKHFSDIYTSFQGRNLNRAIKCLDGINKLPNKFIKIDDSEIFFLNEDSNLETIKKSEFSCGVNFYL